jgi:hypothetical protein
VWNPHKSVSDPAPPKLVMQGLWELSRVAPDGMAGGVDGGSAGGAERLGEETTRLGAYMKILGVSFANIRPNSGFYL